MEMKAMLTFRRDTLEELITAKARQSGFVVDGDIEWDGEDAIAMVRPMSPAEKMEYKIDDRPIEEIVYAQLQGIMEQLVDVVHDEHDKTREAADTSIMEWLEPFRTAVTRIEAVVVSPARMSEIAQQTWGVKPAPAKTGEEEEEETYVEARGDFPEPEDPFEAKRRARFARLRNEMEAEQEVADGRTRLKGESDEFPEDRRNT